MKYLFVVFLLVSSLMAFEHKVEVALEAIGHSKDANEFVTSSNIDVNFKNSYFDIDARVEFLYSSKYIDKRYVLLNELYVTKEFDEYIFTIGKKIKYLGELEGYNVADIYNQKNYLKDPFDKNAKYGSIGLDITKYFDENSIDFSIKFYEEGVKYSQNNKKLYLSNKKYTPTFYLGMNFLSDEYIDSETKIILVHGYDIKRNILATSLTSPLYQYAYRVNKILLLSHIIYEDIIYKTEISYTDVIKYDAISDYAQLSFGFEKSFYEVLGSDITLYGEYYSYIYTDDTKVKNIDISELYDNDIFVALKVNFNDTKSSELKFGILKDIKKDEQIIKLEINSRMRDSFIINGEYINIISDDTNSVLNKFSDYSRFTVGIKYTF